MNELKWNGWKEYINGFISLITSLSHAFIDISFLWLSFLI